MEIKFFKKEKGFKKESLSLNVNFYWELAVCFVFVAMLVSLFFGYYLFKKMNQESTTITGEGSRQGLIEKERIDKVLEYFTARKQKSNQIINATTSVVDPSL